MFEHRTATHTLRSLPHQPHSYLFYICCKPRQQLRALTCCQAALVVRWRLADVDDEQRPAWCMPHEAAAASDALRATMRTSGSAGDTALATMADTRRHADQSCIAILRDAPRDIGTLTSCVGAPRSQLLNVRCYGRARAEGA